jgi:RNA-splicing ligase RtcB
METVRIAEEHIDFAELDRLIYERIPSGMHCRDIPHAYAAEIDLSELRCFREINSELAYKSIGSLGGGNHFIEVDKDDEGNFYLVVHSGSRHLGLEVATYYQQEAYKHLCGNSKIQIQQIIQEYKAQGRQREIQAAIEEAQKRVVDIDPASAYVEGALFDDYIHDMKIVQRFAVLNRKAIIDEIVSGMGWHIVEQFTTIHNYIDTDHMILRKGAVSAQKDEILLIPINMRDGSLICRGKGNEDWNCSAPHGAGRLMSRGKARATLELEEFEREMQGIYTTSVNQSTIDEAPMAYKSLADIVDNIEPTVEILKRIVPVYNFKSSE